MNFNLRDIVEIIPFLKQTTVPISALVILVSVAIYIYKLLNTEGPLTQRIFKSKNPRWDTKIPLREGDKLNQLVEDIKRQEVFRLLEGIDTDVSKINLLIELKSNHPIKINYRMIRNAMSYLRFNNGAATVEITGKDKVMDIVLVVLFSIPIMGYFLLAVVLIFKYTLTNSENSELPLSGLLALLLGIITMLLLGFLRRPYLSAKRINEVMDENLKILIKKTEN